MVDSENSSDDQQNDEVIGRALKGSLLVVLLAVGAAGGFFLVRHWMQPEVIETEATEINLAQQRDVADATLPSIPLKDITGEAGIDWVHVSGMEGEKLLPETMGGGVAVFDYDRDGDNDLLFVGGTTWPWANEPNNSPRSLCLYENDGAANFRDVTAAAGLQSDFYGMGPAVGDFDNDGWPDLFVTAVGKNYLFKNENGKFRDVTSASGLEGLENGWSSGAAWFDYDRDGRLDLFVADYVVWNRDLDQSLGFSLTGVGRAYGQPTSFTGTQSHLYHNEGSGEFRDVTEDMGISVSNPNTGVPVGKGLGVAAIDVDEDGWQDIVVANDTVQNFLFLNIEGRAFEETGIPMGVALDRSGNATGAMGIDCGYLRNNDLLAIAIGNFANEQSSLFVSKGPGTPFFDSAMATGLGPQSRPYLTFGMFFADLDLDSRLDLVCANGHLEEEISKVQATQQYEQSPQFFWNAGTTSSNELVPLGEEQIGASALERMVGRGAAFGDLDNDGDLDVVLVANSGMPRVLKNEQKLGHHWLRLMLEGGEKSNRDAIGATVVVSAGGVEQRRSVVSTRSYLSQCERELTFGLGDVDQIDSVQVEWPSGNTESFQLEVDQVHVLTEGAVQAD